MVKQGGGVEVQEVERAEVAEAGGQLMIHEVLVKSDARLIQNYHVYREVVSVTETPALDQVGVKERSL